jgi:hypothetical protein
MMFTAIPIELLLVIKSYLTDRNYWKFLLACNRLFADIRLNTGKILLFERGSKQFLEDSQFRDLILSKIKGSYGRLSLRAYHNSFGMYDGLRLAVVQHVPSCDLFVIADELHTLPDWANLINNRREVILKVNSVITAFPSGLNFHRLDVIDFSALSDVSSFSHLKVFSLSGCAEVQDVRCLCKVDDLYLYNCPKIVDVSALGKVRRLWLEELPLVNDISALTENYTMTIMGLAGVEVVARVMNVVKFNTDLSLSLLEKISFPKLFALGPSTPKGVTNVQEQLGSFISLQNLFCLHLERCANLTTLGGMNKIPVVEIKSCLSLTDISDLGGNQSVTIVSCFAIENFVSLRNIPVVSLRNCNGFAKNYSEVDWNVKHFTLENCGDLKDVSVFGKIKHLELYTRVDDFKGLSHVPVFEFNFYAAPGKTGADYFKSLENGNNHKIVFPPTFDFENFMTDFPQINDYHVIQDKFTDPYDMRWTVTLLRKQLPQSL